MLKHLLFLLYMFPALLTEDAICEELFSYKEIRVSVNDGYSCQTTTFVRLDVTSEEQIRKSRIDMQEMSDMVKTYLWLDCNKIESISYLGYIEGKEKIAYRAIAKKEEKWFLNEQELKSKPEETSNASKTTFPKDNKINQSKTTVPPVPQPKPDTPITSKSPSTQKTLEEASANGSINATMELVKGLLGLSGADPNINFQKDSEKGKRMLEDLASQGNLDAKHLLGEAYRSHAKLEINLPLLNKITNELPEDPVNNRGEVATQLTIEAAAKGGEEAIVALKKAGQSGANLAYYALGAMYLLDEKREMPAGSEFIKEELQLELDDPGSGGFGNADIGLHFLTLAAEGGNAEAQSILRDLDIEFDTSGQAASNASANFTNSSEPNQQAPKASTTSNNPFQKTDNTSSTQAYSASSAAMTLAKSIQSLDSVKLDEMVNSTRNASGAQAMGGGTGNNISQQQGSSSSRSGVQNASRQQGGKLSGSSQAIPANTEQRLGRSTEKQNTESKPIEILD